MPDVSGHKVYVHSAWALKRAQAAGMYNSFSFQMLTFSLIMLGFVLDMAEAQVMCVFSRTRVDLLFSSCSGLSLI